MKKRYSLICSAIIFSVILSACSSGAPAPAALPAPSSAQAAGEATGAAPAMPAAIDEAADKAAEPVFIAPFAAEDAAAPPDGGYARSHIAGQGEPLYGAYEPSSGEAYLAVNENKPVPTAEESMLTFSLKVDTAAYTNAARYIESGMIPPFDAVRIEEMINYFNYEEKVPVSAGSRDPFGVYAELGPSPFDPEKHMAFIRVRSRDIDKSALPGSNLTFLIDASGSMSSYDKLPLIQKAFSLLVETLDEKDTVSIVTYAGKAGVALDSVSGDDKRQILDVINSLSSSGSTAGQGGIMAAYALAEKNFIPGGNNRIILATDGDFNVGMSTVEELEGLISRKKEGGVYLSVLGVGTGNIRDDIMETLAKHGNGNYSYIGTVADANKALVEEMYSNLFVVADDVKAQVEFNPRNVSSYRLIGYENRALENRDFTDDRKDAGEIGIGADVVVMFELELNEDPGGDSGGAYADELFEVRIRYKEPGGSLSTEMLHPVGRDRILAKNTADFRFACSVAGFGHLLRQSPYVGSFGVNQALAMAESSLGADEGAYRLNYLNTLEMYRSIAG